MTLEISKNSIIEGIYVGKEILFFFIGIFTLALIPFLHSEPISILQTSIIGAALTLEGFSSVIELGYNFVTDHIKPWYERKQAKRKRDKNA